jgi:hypothetical protein
MIGIPRPFKSALLRFPNKSLSWVSVELTKGVRAEVALKVYPEEDDKLRLVPNERQK